MIALFSDPHIGSRSFNKSVFKLQLDFFEKQMFPFLLKHDVKHVICLGDFVHNRSMIDLYILDKLKKHFFSWFDKNGVTLHCIIGNHDTYYKNSLEPNFYTENIKEFSNIIVYSDPTKIVLDGIKIGMMPWIIDEHEAIFPEDIDVLAGHFDIKSFPMHSRGINSVEGFDREFFSDYSQVLSGHYHVKSNKGNIRYLGTPYQLSWSDFDVDKGFWVMDSDQKIKFVPNTLSPKFIKIHYREYGSETKIKVSGVKKEKIVEVSFEEAINLAKKNFVKLIVENIIDHQAFDSFFTLISNASKDDYKIEVIDVAEIVHSIDQELSDEAFEDGNTIKSITQYIGAMKFDEKVNKQLLLDICLLLHKKAEDVKVEIQTQIC